MSFLWTMSRHPRLYEIAREAQRPQRKERFKLAWPVQVRDLGTIRGRTDGMTESPQWGFDTGRGTHKGQIAAPR